MGRLVLLGWLLIYSGTLFADHIGRVVIDDIRIIGNFALVGFESAIAKPACATVDNYVFVALNDPNEGVNNRRLSVMLAAQAQRKFFNPNCPNECKSNWLGEVGVCYEVRIEN